MKRYCLCYKKALSCLTYTSYKNKSYETGLKILGWAENWHQKEDVRSICPNFFWDKKHRAWQQQ